MIGLGILFSIIAIAIIWVYHIPDRKPVSEVEYGQSCYDVPVPIMAYDLINWEHINEYRKSQGVIFSIDIFDIYPKIIFFLPIIMVIGRYLIKGVKWVAKNKTL